MQLLKTILLLYFPCWLATSAHAQQIDRHNLVSRHNVINNNVDSFASLSVGNGKFAFTVDVTGLQSFPEFYQKGVPLGTQSEWGWHNFKNDSGYQRSETWKNYKGHGRDVLYSVQWDSAGRQRAAADWFRQNPHRLQLGNIGFEILKKDGSRAAVNDLQAINQQLLLWTGEIKSSFKIEGTSVAVSTVCDQQQDIISVNVQSELLREGRLKIFIRFPYPTGQWTDEGTNYEQDDQHQSTLSAVSKTGSVITHQLDGTKYQIGLGYTAADIKSTARHYFLLTPGRAGNHFEFNCRFAPDRSIAPMPGYAQTKQQNAVAWQRFWKSGGAIDFKGSTDPRANELERRIILSQYLLRIQEAGSYPPQETGLTYNSWFGKPHLEMHWWHTVHNALWGRADIMQKSMKWYQEVLASATAIAKRQGFTGARWQKMTDNAGEETPSSVGALLIWQQPHFIYFAELCYRDQQKKMLAKSSATLNAYKDLVFATAEFMASYASYDSSKKRYQLGPALIPAQERFRPNETFNPTFELAYWRWALNTAQQWKERLQLPRDKKWDQVLQLLSALPRKDAMYLAAQSAPDSYTNPVFRTDHPAVLGAFGMLPGSPGLDSSIMKQTFDWIWKRWSWKETWGWDFPLTAMTATRLGLPELAVDALMMNVKTNTYLKNGHNYQDERLRIYLPGNGALLSAIAMMVAGFDGNTQQMPGIPKNGKWKLRWEGLKPMP